MKRKTKTGEATARAVLLLCLTACAPLATQAQRHLTLDSCRAMALRNNKQMRVAEVKQDVAANIRRSARTKYLPRLSAVATYQFTSKPVQLLSDDKKTRLNNLGTNSKPAMEQQLGQAMQQLPQPQTAQTLGQMGLSMDALTQMGGQAIGSVVDHLNAFGSQMVEDLRTDTRNIWAGSILLTQPVFMGGSIVAANRMADLQEDMARNTADARRQATLYDIDRAYWQVVSLNHKKKLAEGYRDLVKKLDGDVEKMIAEGVATKSEGLSVSVKVNEAEMALTQVSDGLTLSKMLLCQLCGLPLNEQVTLADENSDDLASPATTVHAGGDPMLARPELRLLQNTVDMANQGVRLLKAGNMPQVALTGGYAVSNPNVLNGFQKKFGGFWHVGLTARIPIWNWGDVMYKVRASKGAAAIATLELDETREMIELQVSQSTFRVDEANKKLAMAQSNIKRAEENLRTANLGFREGVITPTAVMEAQTAWLQAQSQKIDAEIETRLSQVELQKAMGTLE